MFFLCFNLPFEEGDMDWARAIEINQAALTRIVAALIAMVGLAASGAVARLPRPLYRAALRTLRPAESAVRRLIVIAARGIVVKPQAVRPMPRGLAIARKGGGLVSFQLFDTRKRFSPPRPKRIPDAKLPRIWFPSGTPSHIQFFRPEDFGRPEPATDDSVDATRLGRRLMAIKQALETLPRQAKRLVRWQAKRKAMASPKFISPLRIGRPPGHRKKPRDEVDWVLKECHALARDVLREDSS
jgi:hypothetical protein